MINDREYISAVNLPSGSKKYIKDEEARQAINTINGFLENTKIESWNIADTGRLFENTYVNTEGVGTTHYYEPYFTLTDIEIPAGATTLYFDCTALENQGAGAYSMFFLGSLEGFIPTGKSIAIPNNSTKLEITFPYVDGDYTNKTKGEYYISFETPTGRYDTITIDGVSTNVVPKEVLDDELNGKQDTISDLATIRSNASTGAGAAEVVTGIDETGNDYIEMKSGQRVYLSTTAPTGNIPTGSVGVGFDEGVLTYKDGERTSAIDKFVGESNQYAYETCHINANVVNVGYKIYGSSAGVGVATQLDNTTHYILPIVVIPELWINSVRDIYTVENPSAPEKKYLHPLTSRNILSDYTLDAAGMIYYKGNVAVLDKDTEGAVEKISTSTANKGSYSSPSIVDTGDGVTVVGYVIIDGEYYYGEVVHYDWDYVKPNEPVHDYTGGATVINIDIGTAPLYEGEYVDSLTGKVYRYVDGTLTPQDPPEALPTITSYSGQTRFAYDGENVPSKVSLTYTGWHSELDEVFESIDNKQDELTFDITPTSGSTNPVTSDGVYTALNAKIYGIRIDKQDVNPDTRVTYLYDAVGMTPAYMDFNSGTFNYGSWADIWFVRNNRPVALKFDGTVDYELDHTDFTKKLDGTTSDVSDPDYSGNFMSEMPTVYVKRWEDSRYNYIAFSDKQVNSDFLAQAHTNANGTVNSAIYLPMFKGWKDNNDKLRSLMGTYPTGNTTGTNEVTYASNNGAGWQIWDKAKIDLIMDLTMLITKSTNCRAKIGNGDCNTYNSSDANYGKMKSGYETDGTTRSTNAQFYGSEGTEVTNYGKYHMIAFYIEDLWGNRWDRCLGFNLIDNIYKVKMVAPYTLDSDISYETLTVSPPSSTEGWLKNVSSANAYGDVPTEVGANNTIGFANYFYKNASSSRLSLFGGGCDGGLRVGRYWRMLDGSNYSYWGIGGSPCYNSPS